MRVRFTLAALSDARQARTWYDKQRTGLGKSFVDALEEVVARVDTFPTQHPQVLHDVRRVRMRRFPYAVFFRAEPDETVGIAVLHERRSPQLLASGTVKPTTGEIRPSYRRRPLNPPRPR